MEPNNKKQRIFTFIVIISLIFVIGVMYIETYVKSEPNFLAYEEFSNEYFSAKITIYNPNRESGVAPDDELIYYATYTILSKNVTNLHPVIELKYRDKLVKEFTLTKWFPAQDGSRIYDQPILIEDLGSTTITYNTKYDIPNKFITQQHEQKRFVVKSISELQQEKTDKANDRAFLTTTIIGSITAIAILGTYFTAKNNSKLLEDQKNIMKENSEMQIELSNTENQLSQKHTEFLAMLEVMKIFNDDNHAHKRDEIYKRNRENSLYDKNGGFLGKDMLLYATSVRGTFDNMGKLVSDGYVNKEQFLSMYFGSVIRMYKVLKLHIETERKKRGTNHFAVYFEQLYHDSLDYWKTHYPNSPEPEPY